MEIKTVSLIGLGALGVMFGNHLAKRMPPGDFRVIADKERIERYKREGVYANGEPCSFRYVTPKESCEPADLLIFAVKDNGLINAIEAVKNHVGENTVILSMLNGISSEEMIGRTYGMDKILYCVAQGMDAVKVGSHLTYEHMGMLCFGDREPGVISEKARRVADFFDKTDFPYQLDPQMMHRLWGKFMMNVGVNQTVAVYEGGYGTVQKEGPARETMIAAMREVIALSAREGIELGEKDLNYWLQVLGTLSPDGKPSMRQDMEARRYSEVGLFAGTVLELAKKHDMPAPVNQMLYDKIKEAEDQY